VKLDVKRIESNRNFMNKIWNAARFVFMNRGDGVVDADVKPESDVNRWVLTELERTAREVEKALTEYRFNEAAGTLYNFIWGTYCDWYVEAAKVSLYKGSEAEKCETQTVMLTVLDGWLRLLHPICPFITEALFQELHGPDARLVSSDWIGSYNSDDQAVSRMNRVMELVTAIRSIRGEMNVSPGKKIIAQIAASDSVRAELETEQKTLISLARLESLEWLPEGSEVEGAAVAPLADATAYLPLAGLIDVAEELTRIEKNLAKAMKDVASLEGRLSNQKFVDSAPEAVVAKVRSDLDENRAKLEELKAAEARLKALS